MTLDTYLSRNDLADLRSRDRTGVFAALHSFDDRIVTSGEFPLRTAELLAPSVVPGLAEAVAAGDSVAIGSAVLRAVGDLASESPTILAVKAVTDAADAVLAHRFTFYGETHQLPPDLDWDHNPGTAHWGHDLQIRCPAASPRHRTLRRPPYRPR